MAKITLYEAMDVVIRFGLANAFEGCEEAGVTKDEAWESVEGFTTSSVALAAMCVYYEDRIADLDERFAKHISNFKRQFEAISETYDSEDEEWQQIRNKAYGQS